MAAKDENLAPDPAPQAPKDMAPRDDTVIIRGDDPAPSSPGYSVRRRVEAKPENTDPPPPVTETATEDDFVVLLPDRGGEFATDPMSGDALRSPDEGHATHEIEATLADSDTQGMRTEEWGSVPDSDWGGAPVQPPPLTEALDSAGSLGDETVADFGPPDPMQVLSSPPAFIAGSDSEDTMTLDDLSQLEDIDGLPDLENVEDITALVDSIESHDLASPTEPLDFPFDAAPDPKSKVSFLLPLTAAAALIVAGVFYGPVFYEQWTRGETGSTIEGIQTASQPLATDPDPGPDIEAPIGDPDSAPAVAGDPPPQTVTSPGSTEPGSEPFRQWIASALAESLGTAR